MRTKCRVSRVLNLTLPKQFYFMLLRLFKGIYKHIFSNIYDFPTPSLNNINSTAYTHTHPRTDSLTFIEIIRVKSFPFFLALSLLVIIWPTYYIWPSLRYFIWWIFRQRAAGKAQADGSKKHHRTRDRAVKAFAAPEANAELQSNIDVCSKQMTYINNRNSQVF